VLEYYFEDDLVRLRAFEPSDTDVIAEWELESDSARTSYHIPFPRSRDAIRQWLVEIGQRPKDDHFTFAVENKIGELVGIINTIQCEPRDGAFGYGLSTRKPYQGRGYATSAAKLVLKYFFEELRYQKATVYVYAFNEPSIQLHLKLGFQQEGRMRRMTFTQGQYHDVLIFGITADEFFRQQAGS
jgi:RimJ/RimL family protein N-acetyltransferase